MITQSCLMFSQTLVLNMILLLVVKKDLSMIDVFFFPLRCIFILFWIFVPLASV